MFGINCAPEIFQKTLEKILAGCIGCLNYIDDIIIFGPDQKTHDHRLKVVLNRLKEFNVLLNKDKCVIGATVIDFLGHRLSANGIKPTHDKILAIQQFRPPKTAEETRSFLGLVNFVGKFIPNLADTTEPLRRLTRKENKFTWDDEQQKAFEKIKTHMTKETTLGFYKANDRTQIIADASPYALGAVLVQFKEAEPRIISYASRSLSKTEQKYAQTEKEALALIYAMERFHFYVFGREVELVTDHKALEILFGPKAKPCARIERWVLRLQSYRYKVIYKPGKSNIADPLSRLVVHEPTNHPDTDSYVRWIITHAEPKAMKLEEISLASNNDTSIQAVRSALEGNTWTELAKPFKNFETELCFSGEILLRGTRIVIPFDLTRKSLELAHEGHPGMSVMKRRLRAKVWWPKIDEHVDTFVKSCKGCTLVSAPSAPEPMRRTELPSEPWSHIAIDFLGPLPSGHYLLVIVDYFSRFIEVEIMTKIDSVETIKRLKVIFARFGIPEKLQADNGRQFTSSEFMSFCETNNIELVHTTPYWPQMNGEVERQNRSLLKRLSIWQEEKRDWKEELNNYLIMYRSTPHSVTFQPPAELLFNRNIRDKLPSMSRSQPTNEEFRDRDKIMKVKGKEYGDEKRHAKHIDIKEGDKVLAKRLVPSNKLATTFEPTEYEIIKRSGSEVIIQNPETLTTYKRNVAHVKKTNTAYQTVQHSNQEASDNTASNTFPSSTTSIKDSSSRKRKAANTDDHEAEPATIHRYPKRNLTAPQRFGDYA